MGYARKIAGLYERIEDKTFAVRRYHRIHFFPNRAAMSMASPLLFVLAADCRRPRLCWSGGGRCAKFHLRNFGGVMRLVFLMAAAMFATPAGAHPHVFVDTGIEVMFDAEGRAVDLRITWTYDELYSLLLVQERGLDVDADGVLTEAEVAAFSGFDMKWVAGFAGDTYALLGDVPLVLSGPSDWTAGYAGGMATSTHVRHFDPPLVLGDKPLIVQVYDPGYYTSYGIAYDTKLTGAGPGCSAQTFGPDPAEADESLRAALAEYSGTQDVEADYPAVGAVFAEEVRITCNGG